VKEKQVVHTAKKARRCLERSLQVTFSGMSEYVDCDRFRVVEILDGHDGLNEKRWVELEM